MKQLITDIFLVCFCLYFVITTLDSYGQENQILDVQIEQFEKQIENQEPIMQYLDNPEQENKISIFIKQLSNLCIKIIETFILIVSNLIHILL